MEINQIQIRRTELAKNYGFDIDKAIEPIEIASGNNFTRSVNCKETASDANANTKTYVISDSSIDRYDEIVSPKGLDWTEFDKSKKTVFFNHDYNSIVGRSQWQKLDGEQWISKLEFTQATDFAKGIRNLAFDGFIGMTSIGFIPKALTISAVEDIKDMNPSNKSEYDPKAKIWIWTKAEGLEYSLVGIGANRNANELQNMLSKGVIGDMRLREMLSHEIAQAEIKEHFANQTKEFTELKNLITEMKSVSETKEAELKKEIEEQKNKLIGSVGKRKRISENDMRKLFLGALSEVTGKKYN